MVKERELDIEFPSIEHSTYINESPMTVFNALISGEEWDQWFTQGAVIDPRPGGVIYLRWVNFGAGRLTMEDRGEIVEIEQNRRLVFKWSPAKPTTVSFELEPRGLGTIVYLSESGYEPREENLRGLVGSAVGWGEALTLLKFYLERGIKYGPVPEE